MEYKFEFTVKEGKIIVPNDEIGIYNLFLLNMENRKKKGQLILRDFNYEDDKSKIFNFYFGIIIPTALKYEDFFNWSKSKLHEYLASELYSEPVNVKTKIGTYIKHIPKDFKNISKEDLKEYVDRVLMYLETTHDICLKK